MAFTTGFALFVSPIKEESLSLCACLGKALIRKKEKYDICLQTIEEGDDGEVEDEDLQHPDQALPPRPPSPPPSPPQ